MPTVVFKLFVGQGTRHLSDKVPDGLTVRRTKKRLYASPFGEYSKSNTDKCFVYSSTDWVMQHMALPL